MGNELITQQTNGIVPIDIKSAEVWYKGFVDFSKKILKENIDWGVIPGTDKPCLMKPGAEKLRFAYNLRTEFNLTDKTETDDFLDYTYSCSIRNNSGDIIGQCEGNANSKETKYRYMLLPVDWKPKKEDAIKLRAEKKGSWKKIEGEWIWHERVLNEEVWNLKNTIMKIAQKRAFIGAILIVTGASQFFTQDLDDLITDFDKDDPYKDTKGGKKTDKPGKDKQEPSKVTLAPQQIKDFMHKIEDKDRLKNVFENNKIYHGDQSFIEEYETCMKNLEDGFGGRNDKSADTTKTEKEPKIASDEAPKEQPPENKSTTIFDIGKETEGFSADRKRRR